MAFELSEENHNHCTVNHSEDSDHVVYDQVKVTSSPSLFNEAWIQFFTAQLHLYISLNLLTNLGPQPGETTLGVVWLWSGNAGWQFWKPVPSVQHRAQCTKNVHSASLLNLGGVNQMNNLARITNKSKPSAALAPSPSFICPCHLQRSRAHPRPGTSNRGDGTIGQTQDSVGHRSRTLPLTSCIHLGKLFTLLKL